MRARSRFSLAVRPINVSRFLLSKAKSVQLDRSNTDEQGEVIRYTVTHSHQISLILIESVGKVQIVYETQIY